MAPSRSSYSRSSCGSAGRVTAALLLSFLAFSPTSASTSQPDPKSFTFEDSLLLPPGVGSPQVEPPRPVTHSFSLRQVYHHGAYEYPELHRRRDVVHSESRVFLAAEDGHEEYDLAPLTARSRVSPIERLVDRRPSVVDPIVADARRHGYTAVLDASAWTTDDVLSPDATDRDTVISLAYMAADAYVHDEDESEWEDVGAPFNRSSDFGWESDGLRGHIWADESNSTIVIGLKGTSPAVFDGDGTTTNDKVNDNLFFSCCCAQQGQWTWHQVCDCATGTYACNNTCVTQALRDEHHYYTAARELYSNVTELYPDSTIWLTGHSLGGAVVSMLGLTYGLPAVTFEAVPEALAASRLGLPVPPGTSPSHPQTRELTGAYHFGHTADPIYIGTCNGATATCSFAGYAMESACHTGHECIYDVVGDKGWRVGIGTHKIRSVIKDVLLQYDDVPECTFTPECRDCAQWKMYESNGTETTTTSSSSTSTRIRTRTSTCETPGWWGCLDKTTASATTTTTSSSSTSTCETPGWFGCNDKTTTTTTTTSTTTSAPSSTSCETPGKFWGCWDGSEPTSTAEPTANVPPVITSAPTDAPVTPTEAPSEPSSSRRCLHRSWFGFCKEWNVDETGFVNDEM